jgi:hypothetical protein
MGPLPFPAPRAHGRVAAPARTGFARDVLLLSRPIDIEHMNDRVGMGPDHFDVVRSSAASISGRLNGMGGRRMPPHRIYR